MFLESYDVDREVDTGRALRMRRRRIRLIEEVTIEKKGKIMVVWFNSVIVSNHLYASLISSKTSIVTREGQRHWSWPGDDLRQSSQQEPKEIVLAANRIVTKGSYDSECLLTFTYNCWPKNTLFGFVLMITNHMTLFGINQVCVF